MVTEFGTIQLANCVIIF